MNLTSSEQATFNFYSWEYKYRGYYLFDIPVDIEPPYIPFKHSTFTNNYDLDDGKVPSFFQSLREMLLPSKKQEEGENEQSDLEPKYITVEDQPNLIGLLISFPERTEIFPSRNIEFLSMLSFTEHLVSFEIIGKHDSINIQLVCSEQDKGHITSHLKAYFPSVIIQEIDLHDFGFDRERTIAIADFGINDEFMRPIATVNSLNIDPLTSIIAIMDALVSDDVVILQILFKGMSSPLASDIPFSVSDGRGGSFFADAPEMPNCAKNKISRPLFSVVMRVAAQSDSDLRSEYLAQELVRSTSLASSSESNKLIPLSNDGYDYDFHQYNLHHRLSNRLGFILNADELNTFVHHPSKTVVSDKLGLSDGKTKRQEHSSLNGICIGTNLYQGQEFPVTLDTESRLSHAHIIGATGVGKSTLIANMMLADIEEGRGCAIFDPHGDICDDILKRIPSHRISDVILIDPSDMEFPLGFNLLEAHTEAEKIVLSSDIVSAFKRHATAWGDNMTAVLQNAVNTMLDSNRGGTLIELKRFLIEERFRSEYLTSVDDPSIHYYWHHEYPMVRKGISPLLTRIDTFLRPKLVRYMLAQKSGVDISECLKENKIVLLKLSQGLIGEQNSFLLGSMFLAKFNQAALARQSKSKDERSPYMLYLDEFQNFITPSIERMLSGARKYALGITVVHQELGQVQDTSLLNSILSNPKIRICFRLGDNDAKRLESGFSYFEQSDLQNLGRGEAIMRIGSSKNDFNLTTCPLSEGHEDYSEEIINNVRSKYATSKEKVEEILLSLLPKLTSKPQTKEEQEVTEKNEPQEKNIEDKPSEIPQSPISQDERNKLIATENESLEIRTHTYLQSTIKKLGQDRNFISTIESPTVDGGRIDILLERDGIKIGFEISETNKPKYEVENIKKCLKADCIPVVVVSKNKGHLNAIEKLAMQKLSKKDIQLVKFIQPDAIASLLDLYLIPAKKNEEIIKGFRVITEFEKSDNEQIKGIKSKLKRIFKPKK